MDITKIARAGISTCGNFGCTWQIFHLPQILKIKAGRGNSQAMKPKHAKIRKDAIKTNKNHIPILFKLVMCRPKMKRKIVNLSKEVNDEIGRKCLIKMSFVKVIAKAAIFMALGGKVGS